MDNVAWYIPLSSAQGSYTTAFPIVLTGTDRGITCGAFGPTTGVQWDGLDEFIELHVSQTKADGAKPVFRLRCENNVQQTSGGTVWAMQIQAAAQASETARDIIGLKVEAWLKNSATVSMLYGLWINVQDGTSCTVNGETNAMQISYLMTGTLTGASCYIQFRNDGTTVPDAVLSIRGDVTNFIFTGTAVAAFIANTHSIETHALQHVIRVDIGGDTGYIPVFAGIPS